jgi:hypothetical protein
VLSVAGVVPQLGAVPACSVAYSGGFPPESRPISAIAWQRKRRWHNWHRNRLAYL